MADFPSPPDFGTAPGGQPNSAADDFAVTNFDNPLRQSDLVPSVPDGTPVFKPKFGSDTNPPTLSDPALSTPALSTPAVSVPADAALVDAAPEGIK